MIETWERTREKKNLLKVTGRPWDECGRKVDHILLAVKCCSAQWLRLRCLCANVHVNKTGIKQSPSSSEYQNLSRRAFWVKTEAKQILNRTESHIAQRREVIKRTMWVVISKTSTGTHCDAHHLIKSQPLANHSLSLSQSIKQLHWLGPKKDRVNWLISQVSIGGADITVLHGNRGVAHSS